MNDSKKNLTEEELKLIEETELFMEEVYSDPEVANAEPPADLHDKVFAEIRAREAAKREAALAEEKRKAEERELIELGRVYKKRRKLQKYFVLAAVLIFALALSATAMGGPEKLFEKIRYTLIGREQINVDSDHEDVVPITTMNEENAYQEIEDTFGFASVRMNYLPEWTEFIELTINDEIQAIHIVYGKDDDVKIGYLIRPNYRTSSMGKDMEDEFLEEVIKENEYTIINMRKYLVDETEERWSVQFEYRDVLYSMSIADTYKEEVDKIVENLYFP